MVFGLIVDYLLGGLSGVLEEVAGRIVDTLFRQVRGEQVRDRLRRPHRGLLPRRTADRLAELRMHELSDVPEHEWQAAVEAVRDTLRAVAPLTARTALEAHLRPAELEQRIREQTQHIRAAAALGVPGQAAYDRMLAEVSVQILRFARSLPDYPAALDAHVVGALDDLRRGVEQLPDRLAEGELAAEQSFELRYLNQLRRVLDTVELFEITQGRPAARYSFNTAYVALTVARAAGRGGGDDYDDDLTGAGMAVTHALAEHPRLLLRGGAGAGKTTLLRWVAVSAAAEPHHVIPFFLPLRRYLGHALPRPAEMLLPVARMLADEMPSGWASARLREGRAIVLVDGVDEVPADRRDEVRAWLNDLVSNYPDARYVVTTRPFAVDTAWLHEDGFATFDLLPMSLRGIRDFLACWHDAARRQDPANPEIREWLDESESRLTWLLETSTELRRLAGSPLLCGLICALFQKGNMQLPRDRKGIYEAALDLLLARWDAQKDPHLDQGLSLDKAEQLLLLQRLAYTFVLNQDFQITRAEATHRIASAMRGMRPHDADPAQVLQRTLERTGLLREPEHDIVQFLHRTFRDYLAAREVADMGAFNHLVEHAHLVEWHDVVVMAVAHASRFERDRVLQSLLRGNTAAQRDARVKDRLHLIAAACLEQAVVVDTDEVRDQVERAAKRLIPPATPDEAELLARAGPFVLDLLPGPEGLTQTQAACVIRTAALIGGPRAREAIERFTDVDETVVIDELLRAWRHSEDPVEYARTVLADVDFGDRYLERNGWRQVQHLRYLTRLTAVRCRGDVTPLTPLAEIPALRHLELMQNDVVRDLSPLAGCRGLRSLRLILCPLVRDLSPLARSTVVELSLFQTNADLSTLSAPQLSLLELRHPALRSGLSVLPAGLPLRELIIRNRADDRRLLGVGRFAQLERLHVIGVPSDEEIAELKQLPRLARLTIANPESAAELARLDALNVAVEIVDPPAA